MTFVTGILTAVIAGFVSLFVAYLNRKLPFQQRLNESQIKEASSKWDAIVDGHKMWINEVNRLSTVFEEAMNDPALDKEDLDHIQSAFESAFLKPELIGPGHSIATSILIPESIALAAERYISANLLSVSALFELMKAEGRAKAEAKVAFDIETNLRSLRGEIKRSLCIEELTDQNLRAVGIGWIKRFRQKKISHGQSAFQDEIIKEFGLEYWDKFQRTNKMVSMLDLETHGEKEDEQDLSN